jgi:hypothetical protein
LKSTLGQASLEVLDDEEKIIEEQQNPDKKGTNV